MKARRELIHDPGERRGQRLRLVVVRKCGEVAPDGSWLSSLTTPLKNISRKSSQRKELDAPRDYRRRAPETRLRAAARPTGRTENPARPNRARATEPGKPQSRRATTRAVAACSGHCAEHTNGMDGPIQVRARTPSVRPNSAADPRPLAGSPPRGKFRECRSGRGPVAKGNKGDKDIQTRNSRWKVRTVKNRPIHAPQSGLGDPTWRIGFRSPVISPIPQKVAIR